MFDSHTHFDLSEFDHDRMQLAQQAKASGVEALILIGVMAEGFQRLVTTHQALNARSDLPRSFLAPGLHPFYIEQHQADDLDRLVELLSKQSCVAIGEIGLDFFLKQHKQPHLVQAQQQLFAAQLDLAQQQQKPVLLHIRKAHAEVLAQLKQQRFQYGGIAHAFSGGVQEAKALIKMGFKIGITGQISNPNAKKLHQMVHAIGIQHLVIETDCPDMTPLCCQIAGQSRTRNTPANLIHVLEALAKTLNSSVASIRPILWANTLQALALDTF